MIVLDTDHVSLLKYPESRRGANLQNELSNLPSTEIVAVTIVTVEEQMRGWLASIAKERKAKRQITAYRELAGLFEFFNDFVILAFDEAAASRFDELSALRIRLGAMDLKIAATTLTNDALLLSSNRRDFERVPGLRVENWAD